MAITGNTIFDHFLKKLTLGTADNIQHPSGTFNPCVDIEEESKQLQTFGLIEISNRIFS